MDAVQSRSTVATNEKQFEPARGSGWRRRILPLVIAATLWLNFLFFIDFWKGMKRGYTDFSVFYTAATILREGHGHQLYDRQVQYEVQEDFAGHLPFRRGPLPYIHPPFEALIFIPFSLLPYRTAFVAWDVLTLGMLFGVASVLRRSVEVLNRMPAWKFVILSLSFFPVFSCFLQGQDSILLLLFCALAFSAMKKGADALGGCWFGLAALKFQFIVPIVLLFFIWKRRRVAVGFLAVAALLGLISVGLVGMKPMLDYPRYALQVVSAPHLGGVPRSLLPNLHGLAMGWPGPFSGALGIGLAAVGSIALFAFAAVKGHAPAQAGNLELQFSLAIVVAGLVGWQTNAHDLSLLVLPIAYLANYCYRHPYYLDPYYPHPENREAAFANRLLLPALPLVIGPLWMVLWLGIGMVNLMAIPMAWWAWKIGEEIARAPQAPDPIAAPVLSTTGP